MLRRYVDSLCVVLLLLLSCHANAAIVTLDSSGTCERPRLNNKGEVVWSKLLGPGANYAILSSTRGYIVSGGNFREPDINDSGEIIWRFGDGGPGANGISSNVRGTIFTVMGGGPYYDSQRINNNGEIICSRDSDRIWSNVRGYLTVAGQGGRQTEVNDSGEVVYRCYKTHDGNTFDIYSTVRGNVTNDPLWSWNPDINNSGEIVWQRKVSDYSWEIWSNRRGKIADGTDPSINNSGVIVWEQNGVIFSSESGQIGSGLMPQINDLGQITWLQDGNIILMTSIPEPSTLALLGIGAIGLLGYVCRRRGRVRCLSSAAVVLTMLIAGSAQADVFNMGGTRDPVTGTWTGSASLEFVTVGDPGNAAMYVDGSGSVGYVYRMGTYDVTVGQYVEFLNAVAKTDTYGLYNSGMATDLPTIGIAQNGSAGSYTYSVTGSFSQAANCPIFAVSWGDAARFCNWLQNGQPTGSQGSGTTETGAYTLNGDTTNLYTQTRNSGANYVLPTKNEWDKAAYYKGGGTAAGYWGYPTRSDAPPLNILSPTGTNNANFFDWNHTGNGGYTDDTNYLTPVGAFAASPGPYGTFDMGGNVYQWSETVYLQNRAVLGGSFQSETTLFHRGLSYWVNPATTFHDLQGNTDNCGFRVASLAVPEPSSLAMLLVGAVGLLACAWRRLRA